MIDSSGSSRTPRSSSRASLPITLQRITVVAPAVTGAAAVIDQRMPAIAGGRKAVTSTSVQAEKSGERHSRKSDSDQIQCSPAASACPTDPAAGTGRSPSLHAIPSGDTQNLESRPSALGSIAANPPGAAKIGVDGIFVESPVTA